MRDGVNTVFGNGVQRRPENFSRRCGSFGGLLINPHLVCVQMYTKLLVLSLLLYFWCYPNDADLFPQRPTTTHVGIVYVLLYSRSADGLWATRTPAIRDILSVSTAEMGIVLFGLSIGSMSGILCSAWLVKRFGTRAVIRTTMCFAVVG